MLTIQHDPEKWFKWFLLFVSLVTLAFKTNVLELIIEQNFVGIHFNYLLEVR